MKHISIILISILILGPIFLLTSNIYIYDENNLYRTSNIKSIYDDYQPDEFSFILNPAFSYFEWHIVYYKGRTLYYVPIVELTLIINNNEKIIIKTFTKNDVPGSNLKIYNHSGIYSIYGRFYAADIKLELYIKTSSSDDLYYYTEEVYMLNGLFYNFFLFAFIGIILLYYFVIKHEFKKRGKIIKVGLKIR